MTVVRSGDAPGQDLALAVAGDVAPGQRSLAAPRGLRVLSSRERPQPVS